VSEADSEGPRSAAVAAAVRVLAGGGIVAYPTETVYGLAVDARSREALGRLVALKGRDEGRGISLLVASLEMARPLLASAPPVDACALAERFWPGPLTIVLPASASVADELRGPSGGVALRCSSDPWAAALVGAFGSPVTSTSANPSGSAPARSAAEVRAYFAVAASAQLHVLDGGERRGSDVSTVVEFLKDRATLRRRGALSAASIASIVALSEDPRG
jgi:L-threonylcarbamoyladenylate synthase